MSRKKSKNHPPKTTPPRDAPINEIGHQNKNTEITKKRFWRDWSPIEKFTYCIMIFTCIYSVTTYGIYRITKASLVTTQRAFVFINAFEYHVIPGVFQILPKWENSGFTPANPVKNWVNWRTFDGEPSPDYAYPDFDKDGNPLPSHVGGDSFYIGPKGAMYANGLKIPISIMEKVHAGKLRLFIWGWAEYKDVFDKTPMHRTEFCSEVVVTDMDIKGNEVSIAPTFVLYGPYNKAN